MSMSKIEWSIQICEVEHLKEYENNPRKITPDKLKHLEESIRRFGLAEPIVVNTDFTIIGGHGRRKALKKLGIQEVQTYYPNRKLSEEEFDELNIRLNKNIAGEFDFDILGNRFELPELQDMGFTALDLGVDLREFDLSDDNYKGDEEFKIPTIAYNLVFDSDAQQKLWYTFLKDLKKKFPELDTHSSRIDKYLRDNGTKEED
jgi:hypothetical protein